ncbi:MAG TPA: hypothetical protein VGD37_33905, partial [Kofleriaceae bacterium]
MTAGTRRTGRAYALQLLYARDGDPATDVAGAAASWRANASVSASRSSSNISAQAPAELATSFAVSLSRAYSSCSAY